MLGMISFHPTTVTVNAGCCMYLVNAEIRELGGVCIDDMIAKMACPSRAYASGTFIYVIRRLLTVEREIR